MGLKQKKVRDNRLTLEKKIKLLKIKLKNSCVYKYKPVWHKCVFLPPKHNSNVSGMMY